MFSPCASLVHRQENKSTSSARLPCQTSSHVSVTRIRPHAMSGPITLTRLTQMGYDPPLSLDALPLKQHQGPNSEAEGTDQSVARRGGEGTNWDSRLPYLILGGDTPLVPKYTECTDIQCRKFDVNNNEAFYSKILMGSANKVSQLCK